MIRKYIPIEEIAREWMKDPAFVAAYDALKDKFAVASALTKERRDADVTQEQSLLTPAALRQTVPRL